MDRLLQISGFALIVFGIIVGFNVYSVENLTTGEMETSIPALLLCFGVGLFCGLILLGLGEIIRLLKNRTEKETA